MGLALGIDTSNYKTSIALVDVNDNIIYDDRRFLRVPEGGRGLRQQEAFFQHVTRLPRMIRPLLDTVSEMGESIDIISVSDKPRNIADSYMPCFEAGVSAGEILSSSLNIPLKRFSHQEGHISAGKRFTPLMNTKEFVAFHFSGGTTEALKCTFDNIERPKIEIIGGTKDISFGQLIDRVGVAMGYGFPAGEELDNGALRSGSGDLVYDSKKTNKEDIPTINLKERFSGTDFDLDRFKIRVNKTYINLSGVETSILRYLKELSHGGSLTDETKDNISLALFDEIGNAIVKMANTIKDDTGINDFLFVGGVSSSSYIRSYIEKKSKKINLYSNFASPDLASDNAIGIAFLGGDSIWL